MKKIILPALVALITLTAACTPEQVRRAIADSTPDIIAGEILDRVRTGDTKTHAVAMRLVDGYCLLPDGVRLAIRERYEGRIVIDCDL